MSDIMTLAQLSLELAAIYQGSGHSMPAGVEYLHETNTGGFDASYDGTAGMAYYDGFKVFFSPYGYKIIAD